MTCSSFLFIPVILKTSSLLSLSIQAFRDILTKNNISVASILVCISLLIVHASHPYNKIAHTKHSDFAFNFKNQQVFRFWKIERTAYHGQKGFFCVSFSVFEVPLADGLTMPPCLLSCFLCFCDFFFVESHLTDWFKFRLRGRLIQSKI